MEISLDTYYRRQDDDRKILESLKYDMTHVYRSIKERPADLKPVERIDTTSREEGNG